VELHGSLPDDDVWPGDRIRCGTTLLFRFARCAFRKHCSIFERGVL